MILAISFVHQPFRDALAKHGRAGDESCPSTRPPSASSIGYSITPWLSPPTANRSVEGWDLCWPPARTRIWPLTAFGDVVDGPVRAATPAQRRGCYQWPQRRSVPV